MFEICFVCFITHKIFETPVYIHKKISVGFIIIFCLLLKILSTFDIFNNGNEIKIYKNYIWIILIGIMSFVLITLLRAYSFCKTKWLFDFKYISLIKFLFVYSTIGAIICFISSIISSNIECIKEDKFNDIIFICKVRNNDILYYDNFTIYFKNIWNNDKLLINILYIILLAFEIILSFITRLYSLLIIENLNPEYLICSNSIIHFFTKIVTKIIFYFLDDIKYYSNYEIIAEFLSILAIIFYLELIELKFCELNYNLKKHIKERCLEDSKTNKTEINNEDEDMRPSDL